MLKLKTQESVSLIITMSDDTVLCVFGMSKTCRLSIVQTSI